MKKLLAGFAMIGFAALASAQTISFDKTTFDYGTVKHSSEGHRYFTVTNTGDKPLIISNVQASCGCTTPEWSKDPIMPGKSAQLKVGYNTTIVGPFAKIIEVYSNDPENSRTVINIKGNVQPATTAVAAPAAMKAEAKAMPAKASTARAAKTVSAEAVK